MDAINAATRQYEVAKKYADRMWRNTFTLVQAESMIDVLGDCAPRGSSEASTAANIRALPDDLIASIVSVAMFGSICANERGYLSMIPEPTA